MPYIFDRQKQKRDFERSRALKKLRLNPCPGRSDAERKFLMRIMQQLSDIHSYALEVTDHDEVLRLPEAHIDSRANDAAIHMLPQWQKEKKDEDGYLVGTHDHNRKATNLITVGTWYRNQEQDLYPVFQVIVSPLPCDEWGAVPLNLAHWRAAIEPLIEAYARWRWVHAVRKYWKDDMTWSYGGPLGWRMETCKRLKDEGTADLCTGQAIYLHLLEKYSSRHQSTSQDT